MFFNPGAVVAVIVESELDAILLKQEVGNWCCIIALGTTSGKPDSVMDALLRRMEVVLISLDSDKPGARAAWVFWMNAYSNARRCPIIKGKDPTEAFKNGINLKHWIMTGLDLNEEKLERFCLMTVDGGLTDR